MTGMSRAVLYDKPDPFPLDHPSLAWRESLPDVGKVRDGGWYPRWQTVAREEGRLLARADRPETHDPATEKWMVVHIGRPIAYALWKLQTGQALSLGDQARLTRIFSSRLWWAMHEYERRMRAYDQGHA